MPDRAMLSDLTDGHPLSSSFNLFDPVPLESRIRERRRCQAKPTSGIQGEGPFDICVASEKKSFIDPSSFRVHASFRIRKINPTTRAVSDIASLTATTRSQAKVYPVNMFTKCIFKQVEVELEHTKITTNASPTYPIRCYLHTVTSYGFDSQRTRLRCSGYKKDTAGKQDDFLDNERGLERYAYINGSKM
ncbi:MAG: hypothetical protein AAFU03_19195, partial [Bacteroidota bacterium]